MSFLQEHVKQDSNNKRRRLKEQLVRIEQGQNESMPPEKFNFILDVAEGIQDPRAALRSYHWLKRCICIKKIGCEIVLEYSDKVHATLALNYIREGITKSLKSINIFAEYDGEVLGYIVEPDRKSRRAEQNLIEGVESTVIFRF